MDIVEFKSVFTEYAKGMIDKWFDTNSIQDTLCKGLATTMINANINKYDNYLQYFCDEHGQIFINELIDNIIDNFNPLQIDLTKYNMPFLPNKILLISKKDLLLFKNMCVHGNE